MYPKNFGEIPYNHTNKEWFLRESAKVLRAVLKMLPEPLTGKVSTNKAGIAVGGDVYLHIENADKTKGVLVTITQTMTSRDRPDGVLCYLQNRLPDHKGKMTIIPAGSPNRHCEIEGNAIFNCIQSMI